MKNSLKLALFIAINSLLLSFTFANGTSTGEQHIKNQENQEYVFVENEDDEKTDQDVEYETEVFTYMMNRVAKSIGKDQYLESSIIDKLKNDKETFNLIYEEAKKKLEEEKFNHLVEELRKKSELNKIKKQEQEYFEEMHRIGKRALIIGEYYFKDTKIVNGFANAWCTWYAASQTFPFVEGSTTRQQQLWYGNANQWWENSHRRGYQRGQEPKVGSIIVFKGYGYSHLGHVGVVREIGDQTITIEDMRVKKQKYLVTKRVIKKTDPSIVGYIYVN